MKPCSTDRSSRSQKVARSVPSKKAGTNSTSERPASNTSVEYVRSLAYIVSLQQSVNIIEVLFPGLRTVKVSNDLEKEKHVKRRDEDCLAIERFNFYGSLEYVTEPEQAHGHPTSQAKSAAGLIEAAGRPAECPSCCSAGHTIAAPGDAPASSRKTSSKALGRQICQDPTPRPHRCLRCNERFRSQVPVRPQLRREPGPRPDERRFVASRQGP